MSIDKEDGRREDVRRREKDFALLEGPVNLVGLAVLERLKGRVEDELEELVGLLLLHLGVLGLPNVRIN